MNSAQRFVPLQEHRFEYGSVRRYNVDFCPVYTNPEALIQDGPNNLKLYVVARRNSIQNFQSYMPFDVFTQLNEWADVNDTYSVTGEDIFDRSISSSEDEGSIYIGDKSPFIASPGSVMSRVERQSARRSPSSERFQEKTYRTQSVTRSPAHDTDIVIDDRPMDEGPAYSYSDVEQPDITPQTVMSRSPVSRNVSFAHAVVTASPKQRNKRTLSGRYDIEHLSPTGYSPFASFGAVYSGGLDNQTVYDVSSAASNTIAKLNELKRVAKSTPVGAVVLEKEVKKRGRGYRGRKPKVPAIENAPNALSVDTGEGSLRIADASLLNYVEDTAEVPMLTSEIADISAVNDIAHSGKQKRRRARVSTAVVALPERPYVDSDDGRHSDQGVQTYSEEPLRTSLGVGSDDFQMDEYGSLADHLRNGQDTTKKPGTKRRGRPRKTVNSAMLLNSWYISYGDENKSKRKKNYEHVEPYLGRNKRYPTRTRLPPIQHWNSNMTLNGSSVLFLIGVTSDDENMGVQAQHASGDVVLFHEDVHPGTSSPTAARIQPKDLPEASLVLTDSTGMMEMQVIEANADQPLAISNRPQEPPREGSGELVPVDSTTAKKPRKERITVAKSVAVPLQIDGTVKRGRGRPKGTGKVKAKSAAAKAGKKQKEMTVVEALEILQNENTDEIELDNSPKGRRQSEFYQELAFEPAKRLNMDSTLSDSVAVQNGRHISYQSFFRVDSVETQMYNGSLFQPLIMNSRCRSSNVIIPVGRHVNMGNVKGNFICGYLYCGEEVSVRGLGATWPLKSKQTFFLPIFEEWAIYNDSTNMDANLALTFVSI
ncbi:uncharacterized protein BXIN_2378 [Babesia sp. Xinjiang]|uniref:uncharacterized protein n=1 Tax=Babesia sp. Xinjiang TaxID=462227 RepID=UPI000A260345|nr:uncharacterized protein BXIN_2378 [Babesia sp. Xinjiang]ORM40701.1 hypothetical protein BXIN_2378 [Babesia sp. Xinjiang]